MKEDTLVNLDDFAANSSREIIWQMTDSMQIMSKRLRFDMRKARQ